jgi:hypothetical protein
MFGVAYKDKKIPLHKIATIPESSRPSAIKYEIQGVMNMIDNCVIVFSLSCFFNLLISSESNLTLIFSMTYVACLLSIKAITNAVIVPIKNEPMKIKAKEPTAPIRPTIGGSPSYPILALRTVSYITIATASLKTDSPKTN